MRIDEFSAIMQAEEKNSLERLQHIDLQQTVDWLSLAANWQPWPRLPGQ